MTKAERLEKRKLLRRRGKNIKAMRLREGLTRKEVANALKCKAAEIRRIEWGKVDLNLERLAELAVVFNCEIFDFLG